MKIGSAIVFSVSLLLGTTCFAHTETSGHELLSDLQTLAIKCVVRTYSVNGDGKKVYTTLKNVCSQIVVSDPATAHVQLDNETFVVVIRESDDSDGGDLNNVLVYNANGQLVAQKLNVVAFDNILMGLSGGKLNFSEVEEASN